MFEKSIYMFAYFLKMRIAFIPPLAEAGVFCDDYDKTGYIIAVKGGYIHDVQDRLRLEGMFR